MTFCCALLERSVGVLSRTASFTPRPRRLFSAPFCPSRAYSEDTVSFFLREVLSDTGASRPEVGSLHAPEIRGVAASIALHSHWSVSSVLQAATWSSNLVFASFLPPCRPLRPCYHSLVAAVWRCGCSIPMTLTSYRLRFPRGTVFLLLRVFRVHFAFFCHVCPCPLVPSGVRRCFGHLT